MPSALSSAAASATQSTITLNFNVTLNADSARDVTNYVLEQNGATLPITSADFQSAQNRVTLQCAPGTLARGKAMLRWNGGSDTAGRALPPETWTINVL